MQKSIFKRYLSITMVIVILSFVMLGSVMMIFFWTVLASGEAGIAAAECQLHL
ncbi:MAG: hypothetical protein ACLTEJ_12370 [Neglectibacter timonensis]|uniref:hypothetical protein n=1 Tax=Neglectibacter timonensis TaxID=1776382 RepID=UPI00399401EE